MYNNLHDRYDVQWYMNELGARVVAKSGRPDDRYHMGKLILQAFRDAPDFVLQIDGATDESETCGSVLRRSVQCALALSELGLKRGDVIVLMAPNHLDLCIPYYAAFYLGLVIAPIDKTSRVCELAGFFKIDEPKAIFCQSERAQDVHTALRDCDWKSEVITFSKDKVESFLTFEELLQKYVGFNPDDFQAADFDPKETIGSLVPTGGTTGLPKQVMLTQAHLATGSPLFWIKETDFPTPTRMCMVASYLQWATALGQLNGSALLRYTRLQSSRDITVEHANDLFKKYKPTQMIMSPPRLIVLLNGNCDFSSFETILCGGAVVTQDMINQMKKVSPKTNLYNVYGMSEISATLGLGYTTLPKSSGRPLGHLSYRLVNPETNEDVLEPNVPGELWMKGPNIFKGYYKNPSATKEDITEDGWFKSGDLFYRDEYWNFFFVERIKLLMKYRGFRVLPGQIEELIGTLPSVMDVVVASLLDLECGDLPVAFVVRKPGWDVSAQEIKQLVKESLSDANQLRGGVIFLSELPMSTSTKIDRRRLKELLLEMKRE